MSDLNSPPAPLAEPAAKGHLLAVLPTQSERLLSPRRILAAGVLTYVGIGRWALPEGPPLTAPLWLVALLLGGAIIGAVLTARLHGAPWRSALREAAPRRILITLAIMLGAALFLRAFMAWKAEIPRWHPFAYDRPLAHLGAWLHRGAAWRLVPPWFRLYEAAYLWWFPVLAVVVTWMAWRQDARFFAAFALTWMLLGTAVALLVSSAGPIFYEAVTGRSRFDLLTARLATGAVTTLAIRDALWRLYASGRGSSISAFPSLHVAMPWLFTMATWRVTRTVAVLLGIYTVIVLLASIALGWHYALDGYASLLLVPLVWQLAGRLTRASLHDQC